MQSTGHSKLLSTGKLFFFFYYYCYFFITTGILDFRTSNRASKLQAPTDIIFKQKPRTSKMFYVLFWQEKKKRMKNNNVSAMQEFYLIIRFICFLLKFCWGPKCSIRSTFRLDTYHYISIQVRRILYHLCQKNKKKGHTKGKKLHPIVKLCISFHNCRYSGVWTAVRYKRLPPHANLRVWFIYTHPSGRGKLSWWKAHIFLEGNKNELNYLSPASHSCCNSEKCRKINQLWTWKWYLRKYFIREVHIFLQNTDDTWIYISQTEVKKFRKIHY